MRRGIPWPVRSVIAGAAGTAAMTLAYAAEHRLRPKVHGALDYDDSLIPGKIVANVLRLGDVTDTEDAELKAALKWGYGSAFGLWHGTLRRFLPEPWASAVFGATLMTATFSLFPVARPHASTVAMGPGRPGDQRGDPRRLRRRRGARGRSVPLRQHQQLKTRGGRGPAQRHPHVGFRRLRYQRASVPDGKSSTRPTSS